MEKFDFILFLLLVIFCVEIWTVFPAKLKIRHWICKYTWHFQDFWSAKKMGGLPKISTSPFNWHLQKHSHNNISIQKKRFLPGRRSFLSCRRVLKGQRKISKFKIFYWIGTASCEGAENERATESTSRTSIIFHSKNDNLKSPVCIVFFQVSYHPAGLWGQGESSSKQHWKREKKKKNKLVKLQPQLHSSTPS